jgi:Gamma-glutamyltransferase
MTTSDLRAYQARVLAPTRVRYRGLDIYSMAPPSSSGSTVGEALNILSGYNLSAEPRVTALFHYLEASRLAYADRNAYVGDPRYVSVPLSGLLDPAFAATRRCLIRPGAGLPGGPGQPESSVRKLPGRRARSSRPRKAATPTTSSPPTSGATWSRSPTRSTSSAAAARPCPATASCSTTR